MFVWKCEPEDADKYLLISAIVETPISSNFSAVIISTGENFDLDSLRRVPVVITSSISSFEKIEKDINISRNNLIINF